MVYTLKTNEPLTLVFATSSPRRKSFLARLGLDFVFIDPVGDERTRDYKEPIIEYVESLALQKAMSVCDQVPSNSCVFGFDTIVSFQDEVIGKPIDKLDALGTLKKLSGNQHSVITAISVYDVANGHHIENSVITSVHLRNFHCEDIRRYVETGDPMDKAGSYAIQNDIFNPVEKIDGCYFSVVGLPVCALSEILTQMELEPIIYRALEVFDFDKCTKCLMLSSRENLR